MDSFGNTDPYTIVTCVQRQRLLFSFSGNPSSDLNASIIDHIEKQLRTTEDPLRVQKRVVNIVIEALQNMYHHQHPLEDCFTGDASTILMVGRTSGGYIVTTGNYVDYDSELRLDQRLRELEILSDIELKERHVAALKDGLRTKKGAGLGLIEMARRSSNNIQHKITKISNNLSFFSLHIEIKF